MGSEVIERREPGNDAGEGLRDRRRRGTRDMALAMPTIAVEARLKRRVERAIGAAQNQAATAGRLGLQVHSMPLEPSPDAPTIRRGDTEAAGKFGRIEPTMIRGPAACLYVAQKALQIGLLYRAPSQDEHESIDACSGVHGAEIDTRGDAMVNLARKFDALALIDRRDDARRGRRRRDGAGGRSRKVGAARKGEREQRGHQPGACRRGPPIDRRKRFGTRHDPELSAGLLRAREQRMSAPYRRGRHSPRSPRAIALRVLLPTLGAIRLRLGAVLVDEILDARARDLGKRLTGTDSREQPDVLVAIQHVGRDLVEP